MSKNDEKKHPKKETKKEREDREYIEKMNELTGNASGEKLEKITSPTLEKKSIPVPDVSKVSESSVLKTPEIKSSIKSTSVTVTEEREIPIDQCYKHELNVFTERNDDKLRELADQIEQNGIQHPVQYVKDNRGYGITIGWNRVKASRLLGLTTVRGIPETAQGSYAVISKAAIDNNASPDYTRSQDYLNFKNLYAKMIDLAPKTPKGKPQGGWQNRMTRDFGYELNEAKRFKKIMDKTHPDIEQMFIDEDENLIFEGLLVLIDHPEETQKRIVDILNQLSYKVNKGKIASISRLVLSYPKKDNQEIASLYMNKGEVKQWNERKSISMKKLKLDSKTQEYIQTKFADKEPEEVITTILNEYCKSHHK